MTKRLIFAAFLLLALSSAQQASAFNPASRGGDKRVPLCPSQHYWNWERQACAVCTRCEHRTLAPCRPNADAVCYEVEAEEEEERIADYQSDAPAADDEGRVINSLRGSRPRTGTFLEELRRKVNQIKPRKKGRKGRKGRKGKKKRGERKRRRLGGQVARFLRYQQDDPNALFTVDKRRVEEPSASWTAGVEAEDDLDGTIKYNEDEAEVARGRNGRRRNDLHSDLQLIERELLLEDLQEEQKAKRNGSDEDATLPPLPPLEPAATEKPVIVIGKRRFYATVPSEDGADVEGVEDGGAASTASAPDAGAATATTEATVFGSVISNPHESSRIADGSEDEDELSLLHELLVVDGQEEEDG